MVSAKLGPIVIPDQIMPFGVFKVGGTDFSSMLQVGIGVRRVVVGHGRGAT
jgi:hypothetical protein